MTDHEWRYDVVQRLATIESLLRGNAKTQGDHENRLRSLEKWRWGLAGIFALVVFVLPVALHFIK